MNFVFLIWLNLLLSPIRLIFTILTQVIGARLDAARLVEARQNLGDAAVRDEQLAADVAGADAEQRQLDDAVADVQWQGAAVDEDAPQLVDACLTGVWH